MEPDDFAVHSEDGEVSCEIGQEGVVTLPKIERKTLLVIQVETLEKMLTAMYGEGLSSKGG